MQAILEGNKPSDSAEVAKQYGLDINMYNSSSSLGLGLGSSDEDLSANISIAKLIFSTRLDKDSNQWVFIIMDDFYIYCIQKYTHTYIFYP